MTDFVKKVKAVKRDGQDKALSNKAKNSGNFNGSYSRSLGRPTLASQTIQSDMPASIGNYYGTLYKNLIQDSQEVAPPTATTLENLGI